MPSRAALIDSIEARAKALWTPERVASVLGGKRLLLMPAEAPRLLRAIGLMNGDGDIPPTRIRKYRQINHMLRAVVPNLDELADRFDTVTLLDAGCGRSYLTMLVAWWFEHEARHPVRILGVDWNAGVIETCRQRTEQAGLAHTLRFEAVDLHALDLEASWARAFGDPLGRLHGVVSLHACDTATDDAIALGVAHDAAFIAVAPCCQAELSAAWEALASSETPLSPVFREPHLRRTAAATLTDTYRLQLLRAVGYEASANEFVEAVHTPKNTLIRAMRRTQGGDAGPYAQLVEATGGVHIALAERLGVITPVSLRR